MVKKPVKFDPARADLTGIQWAIVGGESGPRSRPMAEEWVAEIEAACRQARTAFFFKQWGGVRKKTTGARLMRCRAPSRCPRLMLTARCPV
jgi:protein gp37